MPKFSTPCPEPEYLLLLGRAAYTWAYTEWTLLYAIKWATGDDLAHLVGGPGGRIVGRFHQVVQAAPGTGSELAAARTGATELVRLNQRRNDILHARPATVGGQQRLHRWDPKNAKATHGSISTAEIEHFVLQVEAARSLTSPYFEMLRPP